MYRLSLTSGLAAIAALTFCQDFRANCSALPDPESGFKPKYLMTQGSNANYGQFPWMVSIRIPDIIGSRHLCGGTIISARWILTAAHCLAETHRNVIVVFGEIDQRLMNINQPSRISSMICTEAAIHPYYDRKHGLNDIALLNTPQNITFNGKPFLFIYLINLIV